MYGERTKARKSPSWIRQFSTAALLMISPFGAAVWGQYPASNQEKSSQMIPNAPSVSDTSQSAPMLSSLLNNISKDRQLMRNRMKGLMNRGNENQNGSRIAGNGSLVSSMNPLKKMQQEKQQTASYPAEGYHTPVQPSSQQMYRSAAGSNQYASQIPAQQTMPMTQAMPAQQGMPIQQTMPAQQGMPQVISEQIIVQQPIQGNRNQPASKMNSYPMEGTIVAATEEEGDLILGSLITETPAAPAKTASMSKKRTAQGKVTAESLNSGKQKPEKTAAVKADKLEKISEEVVVENQSEMIADSEPKELKTASNKAPQAKEADKTENHEAGEEQELLLVPNLLAEQDTTTGEAAQTANDDDRVAFQMPVIEISASGAKRIMVGQESDYTLRVKNNSSVPANDLVVSTVIPEGIDIKQLQPTVGTSRISEMRSEERTNKCVWKVGVLEPGAEETLQMKFIPQVRCNLDFVSDYDYEKTSIKSGIEVQEPVLEVSIEGRDTIDWGVEDKYRMQVRNTGNGEAQNVCLTVATGDSDPATRVIETLAPGEEKTMEINIKTVLDGEMKIKINAAADYGFSASAEKTIEILRGKLDLFVEAPEMQFVNDTVDYLVHVCNTGGGQLQDVEVAAAIPANVEYVSCSGDGRLDRDKNRILWTIPLIKPEEELVYQVTAKMLRSGTSRLDVTAADKTGISAMSDAQVTVDAIAALEMKINKPSGPIATGSEVEYEVIISNNGTKAAEEIDAGFFCNDGMIPISVDGGGEIMESGNKILFNKVSFLGPGQSVVYKVRAKAQREGNLKVQAVLESQPDEIQLVAEEMNYFYTRRTVARKNIPATEMVAMKPETEVKKASLPEQPAEQPAEQPIEQPIEQPEEPSLLPSDSPLDSFTLPELPGTLPGTDPQ